MLLSFSPLLFAVYLSVQVWLAVHAFRHARPYTLTGSPAAPQESREYFANDAT